MSSFQSEIGPERPIDLGFDPGPSADAGAWPQSPYAANTRRARCLRLHTAVWISS